MNLGSPGRDGPHGYQGLFSAAVFPFCSSTSRFPSAPVTLSVFGPLASCAVGCAATGD
jgi:hypothetical protein